jgi:hypothetical protein
VRLGTAITSPSQHDLEVQINAYVDFLKVFIALTVHTNKKMYVQLFLTPIENCGLSSCHELVIRTKMITTVGAVKILHKEKTLLWAVEGRCLE